MNRRERLTTWLLVSLGIEAVLYFGEWWASPGPIENVLLFALFSLAAWFSAFRMIANWFALLHLERPYTRVPRPGMRVDVFTTAAPGEPVEMFEATLPALVRMRYPHSTYLLDDSGRDELRDLCQVLGVRYIRRSRRGEGAKAGNVNHALRMTDAEFVAILDPDHIPEPRFLDRVLSHFDDSRVGYVQAAQAYRNQGESFVARGLAEQTYELYGPTMMGLHGLGAPLLFGCHTTFRRAALESIGGYAIHNAEDLRTCMRLTAQGWKGVYVPEILARGLTPPDLHTALVQQYRWAHSVFDLLFHDFWRLLPRWNMLQRSVFFMVGTFYFVGVAILINMLLPVILLLTGHTIVGDTGEAFLIHLVPLIVMNAVIRRFGQRFLLSPSERGWYLAGMAMLFVSSFAHVAGLLAALANVRVPYIVTSKCSRNGVGRRLIYPHLVAVGSSVLAFAYSVWTQRPDVWLLQGCALWNAGILSGAIITILKEESPEREVPRQTPQFDGVRSLAGGPLVGTTLGD